MDQNNTLSVIALPTIYHPHFAPARPGASSRLSLSGHVDHGKSTFVAGCFIDTGNLPEGNWSSSRQSLTAGRAVRVGQSDGRSPIERDQNITIDTAQIWFQTRKRQYVIIDAPGHKEFLQEHGHGRGKCRSGLGC